MHARTNPELKLGSETDSEALRQQADRCRRLAKATYDRHTNRMLRQMADGFDRTAEELGHKPKQS